jgi:hypothetical protein
LLEIAADALGAEQTVAPERARDAACGRVYIAARIVAFAKVEFGLVIDNDARLLLPNYRGSVAFQETVVPKVVAELQDAIGAVEWTVVFTIMFGTGSWAHRRLGQVACIQPGVVRSGGCLAIRPAYIILVLALCTPLAAFLISSLLVSVRWAVMAPGSQHTAGVSLVFAWVAQCFGVAKRLAGVELVLVCRAVCALLGICGGGVLVLRAWTAMLAAAVYEFPRDAQETT